MAGIIGANVRRLRTAAGMSQEKLGEAMGVHQSTVAYWENVFSWSPTADDMRQLCALFQVEPNDFYQDFGNDFHHDFGTDEQEAPQTGE